MKKFNSQECEDLFWELFNCSGGREVHNIINSKDIFKNRDNWFPLGGNDKNDTSNQSTTSNQQTNAIPALVEKITNSIDAILLKKCKLKNINPEDEESAPKTMSDAIENFFDIKNGDISETHTGKLAKNIQVIATGNNKTPDLMVYDNGEGQHPDNFKNTFLSLNKNNKIKIHFVQGKFNMGGTGVLSFCGDKEGMCYQLIASKLNNNLFNNQKKYDKNLFGWTIVREKPDEEYDRGISYEYFTINYDNIPSFSIKTIDIGLKDIQFETGSIVKVYSYQLPTGCGGSIHTDLYRDLNLYLYKPALPFWLYENRKNYEKLDKKSNFVIGNYLRHQKNNDRLEHSPIFVEFNTNDIGIIKIQAIVLKKGDPNIKDQDRDRRRNFIAKKSIIYTNNGQLQFSLGQTFITEKLGFGFIKQHLFIHVDCSNMDPKFHKRFFKASRDKVDDAKLDALNEEVIKHLKSNETLKEINEKRKQEILSNTNDKGDNKIIENILSNIPMSQEMISMLKNSGNLDLFQNKSKKQYTKKDKKSKKNYSASEQFPSLFKVKDMKGDIFSVPLNGNKKITFKTDVRDGYLNRPQDNGKLIVELLNFKNKENDNSVSHSQTKEIKTNSKERKTNDIFNTSITDSANGVIRLGFEPKESHLNVGDEAEIKVQLTTPNNPEHLNQIIKIKIIDPQNKQKQKKESQKDKPSMPKIIKIEYKNDKWVNSDGNNWDKDGWDQDSIVQVISDYQNDVKVVEAIAINMSSHVLLRYISRQKVKNDKQINIIKDKYISKMYLHSLFLYSIFEQTNKKDSSIDSEKKISDIFKKYGEVLLYLDTNEELLNHFD